MWFSDFTLLLANRVVERDSLRVKNGKIAVISEAPVPGECRRGWAYSAALTAPDQKLGRSKGMLEIIYRAAKAPDMRARQVAAALM